MTRDTVDAAVARVGAKQPTLAADAEAAAEMLTAGEGLGVLHQAAVQQFLWWTVPRKTPEAHWQSLVTGAAAVFDELGLGHYAEIARSDLTGQILDAWRNDEERGRKRFLAAHAASGVDAPDTALLQWSSVMGLDEAAARQTVERALEDAIVAGDLQPGAKGWRQTAGRVCDATLRAPLGDPGGQTLYTRIITERVEIWIDSARVPAHRRWRDRVSRRLLTPIPPPDDPEPVVASLRWLLSHAVDGAELTQSHYLARQLVVEATERFGWWDWDKPPRSEADVPQLRELRDAAASLRLVHRKGRRLLATTNGRRLRDDPEGLWRELATTLGGRDDYDKTLAELVGLRLLDGVAVDDELTTSIAPIVTEQGWRTSDGPVTQRAIDSAIHHRLYWWRMLGLLQETRAGWEQLRRVGHDTTQLTTAGTATVLAYLRDRATAPRPGLHG
jgi:hypothetical protein